jgi:hypothetical protein
VDANSGIGLAPRLELTHGVNLRGDEELRAQRPESLALTE